MVIEDFNYEGLEDLTFSAYTEISKQDLSDQINFSAVGFAGIVGDRSPVEVMRNAQIISRDVGYFPGDAFYTGPKTQLENGRWVTGTEQNEESEFLTVRNIPNIKVSDLETFKTWANNSTWHGHQLSKRQILPSLRHISLPVLHTRQGRQLKICFRL